MNKNIKQMTIASMFIALGVIIPGVFHFAKIAGVVFLPMHIPVLLSGFYLSPFYAVLVGLATPLISSVLTGMPPLYPIAAIMMFELAAYALIVSIMKNKNVFISLILAMLGGRIVAGLSVFVLQSAFGLKLSPLLYIKGAFVKGMPGILMQLILIPIIIKNIKIKINK